MPARRHIASCGLIVCLLSPIATSCGGKKTAVAPTTTFAPSLAGRLGADPNLTVFTELLGIADLQGQLSKTAHTLFAPTNAAFETYAKTHGYAGSAALVSAMKADPAAANALLNNLIVDGNQRAADLARGTGTTLRTSSALDLGVSVEAGAVILSTPRSRATVTAVDVIDGIDTVHLIDTVIE